MKKEKNTTKVCKFCKTEIESGATICPHCQKPQKKKSGCLILIIVAIIIFLFSTCGNDEKKDKESTESETNNFSELSKEELLQLDSDIWNAVLKAEEATNTLLATITMVTDGSQTTLDLYDMAKAVESRQNKIYSDLMYTEEAVTAYSSAARDYVFLASGIADSIQKYIDKNEMKYLSDANESIESLNTYALGVAAARAEFLKAIGLTDEEILAKMDSKTDSETDSE